MRNHWKPLETITNSLVKSYVQPPSLPKSSHRFCSRVILFKVATPHKKKKNSKNSIFHSTTTASSYSIWGTPPHPSIHPRLLDHHLANLCRNKVGEEVHPGIKLQLSMLHPSRTGGDFLASDQGTWTTKKMTLISWFVGCFFFTVLVFSGFDFFCCFRVCMLLPDSSC